MEKSKLILLITVLTVSGSVYADETTLKSSETENVAAVSPTSSQLMGQLHVQSGLSYAGLRGGGLLENSHLSTTVVSFEYDFFSSSNRAVTIGANFGVKASTGSINDLGVSIGRRWFFSPDVFAATSTKFLSYAGFEAGISNRVVRKVSASLSAMASTLDLGINAGLIYSLNDRVGLEAQVKTAFAKSFSNVEVDFSVWQGTVGVTTKF